jgi:hypothetical protein
LIAKWTVELRDEATVAVFVMDEPFSYGKFISYERLGTDAKRAFFQVFHGGESVLCNHDAETKSRPLTLCRFRKLHRTS